MFSKPSICAKIPRFIKLCKTHGKLFRARVFKKAFSMTLEQITSALLSIKGVIAVAIVDYGSGMMMASGTHHPDFDLEVAAAGNVNVVRSKMKVMDRLDLGDVIHDIQVNLTNQFHILCPCTKKEGVFIYLVGDRKVANLSTCRRSVFHAETLIE